jgi:hypothetical protein
MKNYLVLLQRIHEHLRPARYVEIGTGTGRSLACVLPGTEVIGVDPSPRLTRPVRCSLELFALTSDEYFARHSHPFDLAFIDGMHLFEFALRDFINLERNAHRDSVVLIHDCLPIDAETSSRERRTAVWTGDVWKLIACLREYRPELQVSVVDVRPSGLGIVTELNPASRVLEDRYDEICERFIPLRYEGLDAIPGDWERVRALLPSREASPRGRAGP